MAPVTPKLFFWFCVIAKCQFPNDGCQLWHQLFLNQFSKFLSCGYHVANFQGCWIRGHSQMMSQHWTTNSNSKRWQNDNDKWWKIQGNPSKRGLTLGSTGPLLWQIDDWLYMQWPMLYATDINTNGNKRDSKNDGFWFKSVHQGVGQKMKMGWHNHQGV